MFKKLFTGKRPLALIGIVLIALIWVFGAGLIAGPKAGAGMASLFLFGLGATLAVDEPRAYEGGDFNELPVVASDIIYEGAAVGDNASGYARPLVAGDPFLGFAFRKADNSAGAAGDVNVQVRERGKTALAVTGVTGVGDVGTTVYAADDATFTLTVGTNTAIGKISRHVSGTNCIVAFEANYAQSI